MIMDSTNMSKSTDFKQAINEIKQKLKNETKEEKIERERLLAEIAEKEIQEVHEKIRNEVIKKFGKRYEDCTFENYVCKNEKQKELINICKSYIELEKLKGESLILFGKSGTGKNHLLVAMFRGQISNVEVATIEYMNAEKMELQKKGKNWMKGLDVYTNANILIIPDLVIRKEGLSESIKELLLYIIDERYNNYRPIVICTNVTIPDLKKAIDFEGTERVSDRLREMVGKRVYCMDWESYR